MASIPNRPSVPEDPFDIADVIARHGHAVMAIGYGACTVPGCTCEPEPTPWTYSVGLTGIGQPELVVLGLTPRHTIGLVNVVARLRKTSRLELGEISFVHEGVTCRLVDVPSRWVLADRDRMAAWFEHYRSLDSVLPRLTVQQIVWPDRLGRFPDDPAADRFSRRTQPVLRDHPLTYPRRAGHAGSPNRTRSRHRR